jgi:hypothetical protein
MTRLRLLRAASLALLVVALTAPTTAAATTVEVEREAGINLDTLAFGVTAACGFPVELHTVGKETIIRRYEGGRLVSEHRQLVYRGYLLNPANGRTVATHVAGSDRTVYAENGSIISTSTGTTHRNVPGAGIVSGFMGRTYAVLVPTGVDGEGNPIYEPLDESFSGLLLGNAGLCEFLD